LRCKELPPNPFPLAELSGDTKKPSLDELKIIQDFACLAGYSAESTIQSYKKCGFDTSGWSRRTWQLWYEGYHRAFYRHLAAGSLLCSAYFEPFLSDATPPGFITTFLNTPNFWGHLPNWFPSPDRDHIQTHPLYNIRKSEEWGKYFEPLEVIFMEETRKLCQLVHDKLAGPPSGLEKSAYDRYGSQATDPQSLGALHAEILFNQILHFTYILHRGALRPITCRDPDTVSSHSVSVIEFPSFALTKVAFMIKGRGKFAGILRNTVLPCLMSEALDSFGPSEYLRLHCMGPFLFKVWSQSGVPNRYESSTSEYALWTVPPIHFFAEYMFRKYFGLRSFFMCFVPCRVMARWH